MSKPTPRYSLEAEQGLLACCLMFGGRDNLDRLAERLADRDGFFYDLRHAVLWDHMAAMASHAMPVDIGTVHQRLSVGDCAEDVGGYDYLYDLEGKSATPLNFDFFFAECLENWKLRQLGNVVIEATKAIYDPERPAAEIIEQVESEIIGGMNSVGDQSVKTAKDIMLAAAEELNGYVKGVGLKRGLLTGFDYYDKMTTGFYGKEYIVIGGRPGTGKTSLVLDWIDNMTVDRGEPGLFFSLEMTSDQLAHRFYCQRGRVDFQRLRTGYMQDSDMRAIVVASGQIGKAPLYIEDTSDMGILKIRSIARRLKREKGIRYIVIDYMQLIGPPPTASKFSTRTDEMSAISQHLLRMAKELDIPVIVLAQLNRESEKSDRPREPRMSDLKESGQIEQDAHNITILHNPLRGTLSEDELAMMENEDWSRTRKRVNARICKQRNGPTGDVALTFWKHCMHFTEHKPADARGYARSNPAWEEN